MRVAFTIGISFTGVDACFGRNRVVLCQAAPAVGYCDGAESPPTGLDGAFGGIAAEMADAE